MASLEVTPLHSTCPHNTPVKTMGTDRPSGESNIFFFLQNVQVANLADCIAGRVELEALEVVQHLIKQLLIVLDLTRVPNVSGVDDFVSGS